MAREELAGFLKDLFLTFSLICVLSLSLSISFTEEIRAGIRESNKPNLSYESEPFDYSDLEGF